VVTCENVPEYNTSNSNTFQVEMYFNGDIRISYLNLDATDGLVGLSEGNGLDPDFYASDLSAMGSCGPHPPTAQGDEVSTPLNTAVNITLLATDDGLPDPPAAMTYIVSSLPTSGELSDPNAGIIASVPYTLVGGGDVVVYTPDLWSMSDDSFQFYANDGGAPPEGGDSNIATVLIHITPPPPSVVYSFPLDSDPGWSVEGNWAFGQPTGGSGDSGAPDPTSGYTGNNVYGYNLDGGYEYSMPQRYLTTTAIDCTDLTDVQLKFRRWLGVETGTYDHAYVRVSNNGTTWSTIWQNPSGSGNHTDDGAWTYQSYDISAMADEQPTVYVRWVMGTSDATRTYCGWNVDDIEIWGVDTTPAECPNAGGSGNYCATDVYPNNGDGSWNPADDGDCIIDLSDLGELLPNYGITSGMTREDGDVYPPGAPDGAVDLSDLGELLAQYGDDCN
jgi:hypothetical protein